MNNFLSSPGFLGTSAPLRSDLALVLILLSGILLTIGWQLRVHGKPKYHCRIQAIGTILNLAVVLVVMIPSFIVSILPGIPAQLGSGTYGITTLHAVVGVVAVLLGMFVVLMAYNLVPKSMRVKNKKSWMRASYLLYMLNTLLGILVYILVYVVAA